MRSTWLYSGKLYLFASSFACAAALVSCHNSGTKPVYDTGAPLVFPVEIDLESFIGQPGGEINLSLVDDSVEYIPLETTEKSLIRNIRNVFLTDSCILVCAGDILKFSRKGRFLHTISSQGRGPGEHLGILNISIDDKSRKFYTYGNFSGRVLKHTFDNQYFGFIDVPRDMTSSVFYIGDNRFVASGIWAYPDGIAEDMFVTALLDSAGQIVEQVDFPLRGLENGSTQRNYLYQGTFFPASFNSQALVYGYGCDTIYSVSSKGIEARYILQSGRYWPSFDVKYAFSDDADERTRVFQRSRHYIFIERSPFETEEYLFLPFLFKDHAYLAAYNKFTGEAIVSGKTGFMRVGHPSITESDIGFLNDLDGGLTYYLRWFGPEGDYWITSYDSFDLIARRSESSSVRKIMHPVSVRNWFILSKTLMKMTTPYWP